MLEIHFNLLVQYNFFLFESYDYRLLNLNIFVVDASEAGEGNLEITISARGANIPTQVHPQGNAKFAVSFLPLQPTDHVITIHFNKEPVPG